MAQKLGSTPEEEYEVVSEEESRLRAQIRDLEGFIDEAPQIQEARKREMRVTLPPPEEDAEFQCGSESQDDERDGENGLRERVGRRHLNAMKQARRKNFIVFLLSAAVVSAFFYWVSLVVQ